MKYLRLLSAIIFWFPILPPGLASADSPKIEGRKWVAAWTTAMAQVYTGKELDIEDSLFFRLYMHPESNFGLPDAQAENQTFRMIIKPDIWGNTVRIRLSNIFGDRDIRLAGVSVGVQEVAAQLIPGTNVPVTFNKHNTVAIPKGEQVFSDPIDLSYVTDESKRWLRGRELAVSFAVSEKSGPLSSHLAPGYSYFSRPNSGNLVSKVEDDLFPYVTKTFFLVSELDVLAASDTKVVCAFGDSITDGGTVNGYDGWSDVLSRRLHEVYGDKISVVNMAIGGNTIVTDLGGSPPAIQRVDHDLLEVSGLSSVIWLEGINDLGAGQVKLDVVTEAMRKVAQRLQERGVVVIGATLTSSVAPPSKGDSTWRNIFSSYHTEEVNRERHELNEFIMRSGTFDGVIDMASSVESRKTGQIYEEMQIGDHLHPNRAGHQAMAKAVDISSLISAQRAPTARSESRHLDGKLIP